MQLIDEALELARQRSDVYAARARAFYMGIIITLATVPVYASGTSRR